MAETRSIRDLVNSFVGEATKRPNEATQVYKRAAKTFASLAAVPANGRIAAQLNATAHVFGQASAVRPAVVEDFDDLLRDTMQAYAEVGNNEIDLIARRREIHAERSPAEKRVSIAPETLNQGTRLGDVVKIKYQPDAEDKRQQVVESSTIAFWQGRKEEAQTFTVDITVIQGPPRVNGGAGVVQPGARAYGVVEYGSDGCIGKAIFDIGAGVRFTAAGHYVSVLVGMDPPPPNTFSAAMKIGASIGMFAAPSMAPLLRTLGIDGLAPATPSELIERPLKSVLLLPPQSSELNSFAVYEFLDAGQHVLYRLKIPNSTLAAPIPLTNEVAFIVVTHTGITNANYRLPFQLSL